MKRNPEQSKDSTKTAEQQKPFIVKSFFSKNNGQSVKTIDLEDKIELERREAYIEPTTRDLLRHLLQSGDQAEIIPTYSPGLGFVYKTTDQTVNGNHTDNVSREFLENLARLDILEKSFYDSVSACPSCESTIITLHNRCPKCKSHNVDKTSLTEHIPCGYIDQKSKYNQDRCPKCNEPLLEGQYRNMGRWYVCRECSERFENPEYDLICRTCKKDFTIKEAQVIEVPKFSLNLQRKKEVRQNVASLEDIRVLLTDLGFSIEMPGLAVGQKSGMQHHFSLIGKKLVDGLNITIALDHAISESEVQTSPLILYIYKTSEVKVDIPIFIAMPQLNETAKKIAQGHEILVIEGPIDEEETRERIRKGIEDRIEMKQIEAEVAKKRAGKKPDTSLIGRLNTLRKKISTQ